MNYLQAKSIQTNFGNIPVYTLSMKIEDIIAIFYVATRGIDNEEGAVQRVLNTRRIKSIKDFILKGNLFFNTLILNWTYPDELPLYDDVTQTIQIPRVPASAQVIDGQHRIAGLVAAIKENPSLADKQLLVSICLRLNTREAANIFLNINTEQKPVDKSLIYDLFGIVEDDKEHAIVRATDIANELNDNPDSPYFRLVKKPAAPRGVGTIDLSTIVSALKKYLEPDGIFAKYNLRSLNFQKMAILNYFMAIRYFYAKEGIWHLKTKNPFLQSAGFSGAVDHLATNLLGRSAELKSFSTDSFKNLLNLDVQPLLLQQNISQLDGKTARKKIAEYLETSLRQDLPPEEEYEF